MNIVSARKRVKKRFEKKSYLGPGDYLAWAGGVLYWVVATKGLKSWIRMATAQKLPKVGHVAGGIEMAQPKRKERVSHSKKRKGSN